MTWKWNRFVKFPPDFLGYCNATPRVSQTNFFWLCKSSFSPLNIEIYAMLYLLVLFCNPATTLILVSAVSIFVHQHEGKK